MTKEWKDAIRSAVLTVVSAIVLLVVTAIIKGEDLKGLSKAAAWLSLLRSGIPLWLFLIVLVIAILGSVHWIKSRQKQLLYVEWKMIGVCGVLLLPVMNAGCR